MNTKIDLAALRAKACVAQYGHMHVTGDVVVTLIERLEAAEHACEMEALDARQMRAINAELVAERDALAALLKEARNECEAWVPPVDDAFPAEVPHVERWRALRDRIDALAAKEQSNG